MKQYDVYYTVKTRNGEYEGSVVVEARTEKEAKLKFIRLNRRCKVDYVVEREKTADPTE